VWGPTFPPSFRPFFSLPHLPPFSVPKVAQRRLFHNQRRPAYNGGGGLSLFFWTFSFFPPPPPFFSFYASHMEVYVEQAPDFFQLENTGARCFFFFFFFQVKAFFFFPPSPFPFFFPRRPSRRRRWVENASMKSPEMCLGRAQALLPLF